ncbi:hypothetical protein [Streptomyces cyslabdanicus]|uniref:hypothetical protein n=1 Tax=Streptomyces cyslabdanicus TaxID=1470456 RepID=UPI0040450D72
MSPTATSPTVPTAVQEAFLKAFHAERPAVTADAFRAGRSPDGRVPCGFGVHVVTTRLR